MTEFFVAITGLGFVWCASTGLICAVCVGTRPGRNVCDSVNVRERWRGALQIGAGAMAVGILGQLIIAVAN